MARQLNHGARTPERPASLTLVNQPAGNQRAAGRFTIPDPHPRMNVALTRREAEDIAAYVNTLAR